MPNYYCKSGAGAADYNAAHVYVLGDKIVPTQADVTTNVANNRRWVWECTTAGTTNGAITWAAGTITQDTTTITQNGVVFKARRPGYSSGVTASWAYATIYINYAEAAVTASTEDVYVSSNHAESTTISYNFNNGNRRFLCVDDSVAPPTTAATGASVTTTGAIQVPTNTSYMNGITLIAGSGQSTTQSISALGVMENCSLQLASTGASSRIFASGATLINCTYKFAAAGQGIAGAGSSSALASTIIGGSLLAGTTSPTALIPTNGAVSYVIRGLDLTNANAAINLVTNNANASTVDFIDCKTPASWSGVLESGTGATGTGYSALYNTDNAGSNYIRGYNNQYGALVQETSIVRTGGATDGVTSLSWKLVTNATSVRFPAQAFATPEMGIWNNTTGTAITVTVDVVSSASVNNDELWLEVIYLGAAGSPLGTLITSAKASVLASAAAVPTSTATWASPPATPVYQKMSVTFTPQLKGFIHATVKLCKASKTVYVDPVLQITGQATSYQRQIPGGMFVNMPAGFPASRVQTGM